MRQVVFVIPYVFETSQRFLHAALEVPGAHVGLISEDPLERFDPALTVRLAGHWRVPDARHPQALVEAVRGLQPRMGPIERLIGVLEHLQVPLAQAREALGIPGMSSTAAQNFRDKARMKEVLRGAGVPCARHRLTENAGEARAFVDQVGLPVVIKPPAGAGAVNTFRIDQRQQLDAALTAFPPAPHNPMLLEEFILGEEHSFDSVCIGGRAVWHSISRYHPAPLEVLRNDWIQWVVLLPRQIDEPAYDPIRAAAARALAALGMDTGLSHMEWFRRRDGSVAISEVGARPPGAQITSLLGWAHDVDMYAAWVRLMVHGTFEPPQRRYAAGAAYLRGQGQGQVVAVHGLDQAQREFGHLVVEVKLPRPGQAKAGGYEGEGYVILRHPETRVVAEALQRLIGLVRVQLG